MNRQSQLFLCFFQEFSAFYNMFRPPWSSSVKTPVYGIRPSFVTHRVSSDFCVTLYAQNIFSDILQFSIQLGAHVPSPQR